MSLLVVLHVCERDERLAIAALRASRYLDGNVKATLLLAYPIHFSPQSSPLFGAAHAAFADVKWHEYTPWTGDPEWPRYANHAWQSVARYIDATPALRDQHTGWLWWEADACPLRSGWYDALNKAHSAKPRTLFAGHRSTALDGSSYMNGVGVWPMNPIEALANCAALYTQRTPFDIAAGRCVAASLKPLNHLMVHERKRQGGGAGRTFDERRLRDLLTTHKQAVFYHGCTDGSLHSLVAGEKPPIPTQPVRSTPLPSGPRYTISVLCMNHVDLTKKCIESIIEHSGDDYELFITDNASTDDTSTYLATLKPRLGPRLTLITNPTNQGFQAPNEHVLTQARGTFLVLFNNDMEACPDWLDSLSHAFTTNPKLAITGIANTCTTIDANFRGQPGSTPEYIEGGCLMIPCALARKHGLFSPYLRFIYYEDTDLSLRLRELGYDVQTVDIPISHHHRSSTTRHLNLSAIVKANGDAMWQRWRFYIKRRHFRRQVLLKRRGARGDVLLLTPVIDALATQWPQSEFHVETAHPEMLHNHPRIRGFNPTHTDFDYTYDLNSTYEARPDVHIVQAYADTCHTTLPTKWQPTLYPTPHDQAWGLLQSRGLPIALIHPGPTTWPGKNWSTESFTKLVKWLRSTYNLFTIAVGAADTPLCGCDDTIAGLATPQQLAALAHHAKLFIGLDSMPQHVVAAAGVPSVVLFGATNPARIICPHTPTVVVQAPQSAAPCIGEHGRRTTALTSSPCDGACMRAITLSMVQQAVKKLLK